MSGLIGIDSSFEEIASGQGFNNFSKKSVEKDAYVLSLGHRDLSRIKSL